MPLIGELSALLTAVFWSGSAMVFSAAAGRTGSMQVNITRLLLAVLYLTALNLLIPVPSALSLRQIEYLSISGVIGLTFGDSFLFKAFQQIGARITMLIMSLSPAIAAVLAYCVLGETISLWGIAGISVTLVGVSVVVGERTHEGRSAVSLSPAGIANAILAATGQGGGLIFAKLAFLEGDLNAFVATETRILAALVLLLPASVLAHRFENPIALFRRDRTVMWLLIAGSLLGPFLGISLSLVAVAHTAVGVAATLMATVPIMMLPLVRIVHKERLSWKSIAGAFVAVAGVAILFLRP